ncbi:DUF1471 domain-containing protein [Leclercia sp. 29361]|nr:DUF1471 domain-containing protein [Enterobacter asburiae]QFH91915.1 DUF1471 domain-containing protein [Enterobacter kobei]QGU13460.1 DUF1471 domain-containing protein [Leclercia sp. 119287]QIK12192.1 DUF1471 domain-containing protein [Leclercia sp. 29361]RTN96798.1 DUF1471 domain-containing protein [Enterobacter hormaechei]HAS0789579.1 DUF1471 domain-containing protein [Enterobacter hormaechei subsp. xiangfangensis]HBW2251328.1 DUF1471 domain-containing protein [Klebsiella pneumoniae]
MMNINIIRIITMKNIKLLAATGLLSVVSFSVMAQTVSVTASTLDSAEAKIAAKAKEAQTSYKILSAYTGDRVHMTAKLGD